MEFWQIFVIFLMGSGVILGLGDIAHELKLLNQHYNHERSKK